jgi:tetratricopeptide (TPR) repeat protein
MLLSMNTGGGRTIVAIVLELIKLLFGRLEVRQKAHDTGLNELLRAKTFQHQAKRAAEESEKEEHTYNATIAIRHAIRRGLPGLKEYFDAGETAEESGELDFAVKAFKLVSYVRWSDHAADARLRLAWICAKQGKTVDALNWLRKAVKLKPDHSEAKTIKELLLSHKEHLSLQGRSK